LRLGWLSLSSIVLISSRSLNVLCLFLINLYIEMTLYSLPITVVKIMTHIMLLCLKKYWSTTGKQTLVIHWFISRLSGTLIDISPNSVFGNCFQAELNDSLNVLSDKGVFWSLCFTSQFTIGLLNNVMSKSYQFLLTGSINSNGSQSFYQYFQNSNS